MSIAEQIPLSKRLLPFDGLRGIAAVGVAAFHVNPLSPYLFWAWTFVDLFFVLSGFLIGSILYRGLRDRSLDVKNFWIRRVLRIWPVYYLTLAIVLLAVFLTSGHAPAFGAVARSLVFMQFTGAYLHPGADWNGMLNSFVPWFGHSWSIATEEQFYVLLPIFLWLVGVRARSIFLLVTLALITSQMLLYADYVPGLLGTRMQGLALGLLLVPLSRWLDDGAAGAARRPCALAIIAVGAIVGALMVVPVFSRIVTVLFNGGALTPDLGKSFTQNCILGMALIYFSVVGFVLAFPASVPARLLSMRPLVYLGTISYALYMFHVPIEGALMSLRGMPLYRDALWVKAAYWVLIIGSAHLSKVLIEDYFNTIKNRYPVYKK